MTKLLLAEASSIPDLKIYMELRWLRLVCVENAQISGTHMKKINLDGWQLPIVIQQKTKLTARCLHLYHQMGGALLIQKCFILVSCHFHF